MNWFLLFPALPLSFLLSFFTYTYISFNQDILETFGYFAIAVKTNTPESILGFPNLSTYSMPDLNKPYYSFPFRVEFPKGVSFPEKYPYNDTINMWDEDGKMSEARKVLFRKDYNLLCFRNAIINPFKLLPKQNKIAQEVIQGKRKIKFHITCALFFGGLIHDAYGHCYLDFALPSLLLPYSVTDNMFIIAPNILRQMTPLKNVEFIKDPIAVDYLFHLDIPRVACFHPFASYRCRDYLRQRYNLDVIKSEKYIFYHSSGNRRRVGNFKEIFKMIQKNFQAYNFSLFRDTLDYSSAAKKYASVKYFFSVSSSGITNCIFMRLGTTVAELASPYRAPAFSLFAECLGLNYFIVVDKGTTHYPKKYQNLNWTCVSYLLNKSLPKL